MTTTDNTTKTIYWIHKDGKTKEIVTTNPAMDFLEDE